MASSSSANGMTDRTGTEDLFLSDAHPIVDAGKDGRIDKPAVAKSYLVGRATTQHDASTSAVADCDIVQNLPVLRRRCHRPALGIGICRVTHPRRFGKGN